MQRPYEYYLNADTSVIQRSITSDVNNMYGLYFKLAAAYQRDYRIYLFDSLLLNHGCGNDRNGGGAFDCSAGDYQMYF